MHRREDAFKDAHFYVDEDGKVRVLYKVELEVSLVVEWRVIGPREQAENLLIFV